MAFGDRISPSGGAGSPAPAGGSAGRHTVHCQQLRDRCQLPKEEMMLRLFDCLRRTPTPCFRQLSPRRGSS